MTARPSRLTNSVKRECVFYCYPLASLVEERALTTELSSKTQSKRLNDLPTYIIRRLHHKQTISPGLTFHSSSDSFVQ